MRYFIAPVGAASQPSAHNGMCPPPDMCPPPICVCRSGFTREYGGGSNSERRVEIGQQARPFHG
ncbi:hypothetical protein CBP05_14025 [Pseudomonas putida]|nr:hypothetical protein CBP05_14025 [Pseudomonas putida]OUS88111.1 hypothetical protein CBP06_12060 [Pseudomonas putida]